MQRKRSAIEPPAALVGCETTARPDAKRPASIILGSGLVLGRTVASVLWLVAFSLIWHKAAAENGIGPEEAVILHWAVAIISGAVTLVLLLFSWLIWRGSNAARVVTMCVLTISILSSAISYFILGDEITMQSTLLTVALDILVLLALSSRDARAWARRAREKSGHQTTRPDPSQETSLGKGSSVGP